MEIKFKDLVIKNFSFLLEIFNFHIKCKSRNIIIFEKNEIEFVVGWDFNRSHEIVFDLGFSQKPTSSIPLYYLIEEFGSKDKIPTCLQVSDIDVAEKYLKIASDFLKNNLSMLLAENNFIFIKIQNKYLMECKIISHNECLSQRLYRANILWRNKDYKGFIDAVSSISNDLPLLEQKKLVYAKKHIDTNKK